MNKLYIPPVLILYGAIIITLVYFLIPEFNNILFPFNLIGIIISALGLALMGKVKRLFKKYKTTLTINTSTHLIEEGVFSITRNPMYVGMVLFVFGTGVFSTNLFSLLVAPGFILLVRIIFVPKEERLMHNTFGKKYTDYKKKVRRWI